MENKTDKPYSLQISDLLDNILPADGVGTERERLRMTLHTEISKATEELRNAFDEAVESNENLRKEMEGLIEIHRLQSEEFLSELTQVTGEKEELRKENEELQTQVSMFQTDRSERIEEMKRLKESNKQMKEIFNMIKPQLVKHGFKGTTEEIEKFIQKSEGDVNKKI